MNQQEVEQWIAQNGGLQAVQYARATTQVDNPAADPITARQAGVRFDPNAPPKIAVATEKWTNPTTGAVLHVRRRSDGEFDIVEQATPNPAKAGTGQSAQIEGTPDPSKPGGFDNERPRMVTRDASGNLTELRELTPAEAKDWRENRERSRNPNGRSDAELQAAQPKPQTVAASSEQPFIIERDGAGNLAATPNPNYQGKPAEKPTVQQVQGGDGKSYVRVISMGPNNVPVVKTYNDQGQEVAAIPGEKAKPTVQAVKGGDGKDYIRVLTVDPNSNAVSVQNIGPDGQSVAAIPGEKPKPTIIKGGGTNGEDVQAVPDPETGQYTYQPIPGAQPGKGSYTPLPPGVPAFTTRFDVPDLGLGDRKAQLDALVTQGVITPAQANATMTADAGNAKAGAENLGAIVTIQEQNRSTGIAQRGQDLGEQQSRRSFVGGLYNQAASGFNNSKVLPGAGAASANGFLAMMQAGMNLARQNGGFRDVPRVENGPLLNQFGQATLTPSGSYTVPTAAGSSAAPAAAPSAEDLPWLQHAPLTNSGAALAPAAQPAAAAPDTSSAITITIPHSPALLQPAPATTSGPLLAPPPLDPGETVTPQAGMWHPNHDGLIDDMVNAGFEPDAIAAAFPDLHRYGPSPSLVA